MTGVRGLYLEPPRIKMNGYTRKILGVEVRHFSPWAASTAHTRLRRPIPIGTAAGIAAARYESGMAKLKILLEQVCWDAEISVATVTGPRRGVKPVVTARRAFARAARRKGFTVTMIATILNRHHTSICSLLQ
jgi:hypothetical protein